jgi:uncharacterized membrane protein YccF (DUF307 family)
VTDVYHKCVCVYLVFFKLLERVARCMNLTGIPLEICRVHFVYLSC